MCVACVVDRVGVVRGPDGVCSVVMVVVVMVVVVFVEVVGAGSGGDDGDVSSLFDRGRTTVGLVAPGQGDTSRAGPPPALCCAAWQEPGRRLG